MADREERERPVYDDALSGHDRVAGLPPGGPVRMIQLGDIDVAGFTRVLEDAMGRLRGAGIPHVVMGGLAVTTLARPRWTHDIDVFLRPRDAVAALDVLSDAGYDTERTDPGWLFKAVRDDIPLDLIFRSSGHLYLDEAMVERAVDREFMGVPIRVIAPEDLLVVKAAADEEHTHYHWFDAIGLLARHELDWEYVLWRGRHTRRHLLSLLVYADAKDVAVPAWVIRRLHERVYGEASDPGAEPPRHDAAAGRLEEELRERLRHDARTADLDVGIAVVGDHVVLTGEVATEQRRADLCEVAGDLLGRRVEDRLTVRSVDGDAEVEVVR